jgi:hypothetical protein
VNFELRKIPISKGLFATKQIKRGETICQIKGTLTKNTGHISRTCIEFNKKFDLEPYPPLDHINHSCDPNCLFQNIEGRGDKLFLVAIRKINKNEQLTTDYAWELKYALPCRCGSKKCKGVIIDKKDLKKYKRKHRLNP